MKKDMGGAASGAGPLHAMIMNRGPGHVALPGADPGVDVITPCPAPPPARRDLQRRAIGKTVGNQINTDAEGDLGLADAPGLRRGGAFATCIVSMATLTGAARVAVGPAIRALLTETTGWPRPCPWLPPMSPDRGLAASSHTPLRAMYRAGDRRNLTTRPSAGSRRDQPRALLLRRFVGRRPLPMPHFDIYRLVAPLQRRAGAQRRCRTGHPGPVPLLMSGGGFMKPSDPRLTPQANGRVAHCLARRAGRARALRQGALE